MTDTTPGVRTIVVTEDVHDVLQRTADSRVTDMIGALRQIMRG